MTSKKQLPNGADRAREGSCGPTRPFVAEWVPGFWEELNPEEIPPNLRYWVEVRRSTGGQVANWVAYRMGNRIEVIGDFDEGVAVLKLPASGTAVFDALSGLSPKHSSLEGRGQRHVAPGA